jgi:lipopolysaccharide transport system permease protein
MKETQEDFDLIIEPGKSEKNYWFDLWRYKELFYTLAWRDIKVRYKQTVIGIAWSIVRPLLTMLVFTFVFGRIAKMSTNDNIPYTIIVFSGLLPWQFFSNSLAECSNSLIGNSNLISKVYFPRLIVPASSIITSFVDFVISFFILLILFIYYKFIPSWHIIFMPFFILLSFLASFGVGLLLSTLSVKFRDFRYIVPFILQLGLYVSPVGFSSSVIPNKWKLVYSFNPMVGIIDGFRWCIIGDQHQIYIPSFIISLIMIAVIIWYSIKYFRKTEKGFADFI